MIGTALLLAALAAADTEIPPQLTAFRPLIGEWRGVGMVRRGSSAGSWRETAEWRFDFTGDSPAVVYDVTEGKHLAAVRFTVKDGKLAATLTRPDAKPVAAEVAKSEDNWVVTSTAGDAPLRVTVNPLNEKRTVVLIEEGRAGSDSFRRLGEAGYTRSGTRLATPGSAGPECVVTGGLGTIEVTHDGRTYYVCCTGCKAAFEADPEAILAEAAARRAEAAGSP